MDYSGKYRPVRPLRPEDDFNHPVEPSLYFNESRYINLLDGQRQIGGWFRIGNRPNQGYAEMTCCLYLPGGRVGFMFAKPEMSVQDCFEASGLSFSITEPFKHLRMKYRGKICLMQSGAEMEDPKAAFKNNPKLDCSIDIEFTAIASAHGGELLGEDGQPFEEGEGQQFARAHYDQHMKGTGSIRVGDETFPIDGFGLRDHSWGPRIWQAIPWYRWFPCAIDESFGFCLLVCQKGDGSYIETGFIYDGSEALNHVASVKLRSEYDDSLYPLRFTIDCTTEEGAAYVISGEPISSVPCRHLRELPGGGIDKTRIMESMTRYTCSGKTGYGMAEYLDHVLDGEFEGIKAGR